MTIVDESGNEWDWICCPNFCLPILMSCLKAQDLPTNYRKVGNRDFLTIPKTEDTQTKLFWARDNYSQALLCK